MQDLIELKGEKLMTPLDTIFLCTFGTGVCVGVIIGTIIGVLIERKAKG